MQFTTLSLLAASAVAHMKIKAPTPRDNNGLRSLTGPCGEGFDSPVAGIRAAVNVNDFKISLQVADADAQVVVNAGVGPDPKTFGFEVANFPASLQNIDFGIDFTKIIGLKNGDLVTVQIVETALDGIKFGCIDLTVSGIAVGVTTVDPVTSTVVPTTSSKLDTTTLMSATTTSVEATTTAVETGIISSASSASSLFAASFLFALL